VQGYIFPDIFSFIFQSEPEDETTRPVASETIEDSSAAGVEPREIQCERKAFVDKAEDNPDEEC
jgi:hypothetical protein